MIAQEIINHDDKSRHLKILQKEIENLEEKGSNDKKLISLLKKTEHLVLDLLKLEEIEIKNMKAVIEKDNLMILK
jgi:hypothetical protein